VLFGFQPQLRVACVKKPYRLNGPHFACKLAHVNAILIRRNAACIGLVGVSLRVHQGAFSRSSRSR